MADINQIIMLGIGANPGSPTTFILVGLGTGAAAATVITPGNRVYIIFRDDRALAIEADDRRFIIPRDDRILAIEA